jgi:hypothetical protein
MATEALARNDLVGVRFTPNEHELLDRLVAHFEEAHPGMRFNKQMVIRAAVFAYAKGLGIEPAVPPPAPSSRPRQKTAPKKR